MTHRKPGALVLTDAVKRRLLHLRILGATESEPTLTTAEVDALEKQLRDRLGGNPLGDAVLALFANRDSGLTAWDVRIEAVAKTDAEAHAAGMPRGFVGFARHPELEGFAGISAKGTRVFLRVEGEEDEELSLESFLDELISDRVSQLREEEDEDDASGLRFHEKIDEGLLGKFEPALVSPSILPSSDRVRHPKFGEGEILRRYDDKLEIRFADRTRTLLSRFVEPA